jgi:hypothetical protein
MAPDSIQRNRNERVPWSEVRFQCPLSVISGHLQRKKACPLYPPIADIRQIGWHVRFVRAFIKRTNREISRRRAIAAAVQRPCLSAFLFPLGAPGDRPQCRHRPFGIAGDWHRLSFLVCAPQRRLRRMGSLLCMGLIL